MNGVDNINIDAATLKGILVINAPDGNTISATEHSLAMLLSMARNIPQAHQSLTNKEWNRNAFKGTELYHKTLGVIGAGRIGLGVSGVCNVMKSECWAISSTVAFVMLKDFAFSSVK